MRNKKMQIALLHRATDSLCTRRNKRTKRRIFNIFIFEIFGSRYYAIFYVGLPCVVLVLRTIRN